MLKLDDFKPLLIVLEKNKKIKNQDGSILKTETVRKWGIYSDKHVKDILHSEIGSPIDGVYRITRQNVFGLIPKSNKKEEIYAFYLAIMMWGYPTGGRGNHIKDMFEHADSFITQYQYIFNNKQHLSLIEIYEHLDKKGVHKIDGMGPSTFTKVLYFSEFTDSKHNKALIFDNIMRNIFNQCPLQEIRNKLKKKLTESSGSYDTFCRIVQQLAEEFCVSTFTIEYFLFYITRTLGRLKI